MEEDSYIFILMILILCICVHLMNDIKKKESFLGPAPAPAPAPAPTHPPNQTAVCFLCVCPKPRFIHFAEEMAKYHSVFIVCDKLDCETPPSDKVKFLKIADKDCLDAGFNNSADPSFKAVIAQDRAMYYFSTIDTTFKYVWFIEDDVYIPRPFMLHELDKAYGDVQLIISSHVSREKAAAWNWWPLADASPLKGNFHHSMACVIRLSKTMLQKVREFANTHKRLVFVEFMFNTIAANNNLSVATPQQLSKIVWKYQQQTDWPSEEVLYKDTNIFHPIKDTELHSDYRARLPQLQARLSPAASPSQR